MTRAREGSSERLSRSLALATVGGSAQVRGAYSVVQLLESRAFGMDPLDPISFGGAAAILATVALVAAVEPALRAAAVSPSRPLRYE